MGEALAAGVTEDGGPVLPPLGAVPPPGVQPQPRLADKGLAALGTLAPDVLGRVPEAGFQGALGRGSKNELGAT